MVPVHPPPLYPDLVHCEFEMTSRYNLFDITSLRWHHDYWTKLGLANAVTVLQRDIIIIIFLFLQFFVSKRHQIFQDYSESFGKHRTVSTFFKFGPVPSSGESFLIFQGL